MAWQPTTQAQAGIYGSQKTGSNIPKMFGGGVKQGLDVYGQGLGAAEGATDYYQNLLSGDAPSLAAQQMQQGLGQAYGQGLGMAAQARGGNIASTQAQAGAMAAQNAQQQAIQGGMLRAQEQQAAAQGLGSLGMQQAGLGLEQNLGNLGMMNEAYMMQAQLDNDYQQFQRAQQEAERNNRFNRILGGLNLGRQWAGDIANSITGGMSLSDERAKQSIKPGGLSASETVGSLDPKSFEYQPGLGPYGMRVGVVAQDLERTPVGNQLVQTGPDGMKRVDNGGAAMLSLAAAADQEKRLRALEGRDVGMSLSDERAKQSIRPYTGAAAVQGQDVDVPQASMSIRPGNSATGLGQAYQSAPQQAQGFGDEGGVVASRNWDIGGDLQQVGTFTPDAVKRRRLGIGIGRAA